MANQSPAPRNLPALLTLSETADALSTSVQTVRRMISRGDLPAYRYGPRLIRIDADDLRALRTPVTATASIRRSSAK